MSIEKHLEAVIHFASIGDYRRELLEAREEFFYPMGDVSEKEDDYEEKLRKFLDWYMFDRPLTDTGKPPMQTFYEKFYRTFNEDDEKIYDGFRKTFISLFIVKKSDETGVWVKDLIQKRKLFVEDDVPEGFFRDEIFQVRLIPVLNGFRFGDAFCFHPLAVNKIILRRVRKLDRTDAAQVHSFLKDLESRRHNSDRYRHVDVVRFYEDKD